MATMLRFIQSTMEPGGGMDDPGPYLDIDMDEDAMSIMESTMHDNPLEKQIDQDFFNGITQQKYC